MSSSSLPNSLLGSLLQCNLNYPHTCLISEDHLPFFAAPKALNAGKTSHGQLVDVGETQLLGIGIVGSVAYQGYGVSQNNG